MSWKQDIVASMADAKTFLDKHIRAAPIGAKRTDCWDEPDDVMWRFSAETVIGQRGAEIFDLYVETHRGCHLPNLKVYNEFKGNRIGHMATKAVIGIAFGMAANELTIGAVDGDGFSFWPSLGAVPYEKPVTLPAVIRNVANENVRHLPPGAIDQLREIHRISKENPYAGWRALAQSGIKMEGGRYISQRIFKRGWDGDDLVIPLQHQPTLTLLESRLGVLPPFMPSRPASKPEAVPSVKLEA